MLHRIIDCNRWSQMPRRFAAKRAAVPARLFLVALCVLGFVPNSGLAIELDEMNATLNKKPAMCPPDSSRVREFKHYEDYCGADYQTTMSIFQIDECQSKRDAINAVIYKYNGFLSDHKCGGSMSDAKPLTGAEAHWSNNVSSPSTTPTTSKPATSSETASSPLRCYPEYVDCNHDCLKFFGDDWKDKGSYCGGTCSTPTASG